MISKDAMWALFCIAIIAILISIGLWSAAS
jgi:hypothetical protein